MSLTAEQISESLIAAEIDNFNSLFEWIPTRIQIKEQKEFDAFKAFMAEVSALGEEFTIEDVDFQKGFPTPYNTYIPGLPRHLMGDGGIMNVGELLRKPLEEIPQIPGMGYTTTFRMYMAFKYHLGIDLLEEPVNPLPPTQ